MLIISKFHDYYDPVGKTTGIDKTIVYQRTKVVIKDPKFKTSVHTWGGRWERRNTTPEYTFFLIGFCGQLYPMIWNVPEYDHKKQIQPDDRFIYDRLEIQKLLKEKFHGFRQQVPGLDELLKSSEFLGLFHKHKVPVWVVNYEDRGVQLELNSCLAELDFQKLVDPYTAFQEIMMYISGVLGTPSNPMVAVSEKTKVAKHGFDKWSFRKPPKDT